MLLKDYDKCRETLKFKEQRVHELMHEVDQLKTLVQRQQDDHHAHLQEFEEFKSFVDQRHKQDQNQIESLQNQVMSLKSEKDDIVMN